MSRLTKDDGQTPVPNLVEGNLFDYWDKILAPPERLVGSWLRKKIDWPEFTSQYQFYLSTEKIQPRLKYLAQLALDRDITLLCAEEDPNHCHRSLLAHECQKLENKLKIEIK